MKLFLRPFFKKNRASPSAQESCALGDARLFWNFYFWRLASFNSAKANFSPKLRIYIFIFVIWVLFTVNGEIKNMSVRTAQINITRPRRFQKNLRSLLYCNAMFLFQNMWSELKSLRWVKRCEHENTLKPTGGKSP